MQKIEIYSTNTCPYCVRAKQLLDRKGAVYTEYFVDRDPDARQAMLTRAPGSRTVPQIFIGETHVGGCDDLHELDRKGELDGLLGK